MKKNIALSLLLIGLFMYGNAQRNKFQYGFESGINFNSMYGKGIATDLGDERNGLHIGGYFKVNISDHFGLKAKLAYDGYRWAYRNLTLENMNGLESGDIVRQMSYLNLPLLAEYTGGNKIRFIVNGGIFFGYLLHNASTKKIKSPAVYTQTTSGDRTSINMGLSAGGGIQIPLTQKMQLDFGVHDNFGLLNIYKSFTGIAKTSVKTNAFTISTGLTFKLR
jgi:hypothetical protein